MNVPKTIMPSYNEHHSPSGNMEDLTLRPGVLLVWRAINEREMKTPGTRIIRPKSVRYKYPPTCGVVVKAGPGCDARPGDYVFFYIDTVGLAPDEAADDRLKPQALIMDYTDDDPALFFVPEKFTYARTTGCESSQHPELPFGDDTDVEEEKHGEG